MQQRASAVAGARVDDRRRLARPSTHEAEQVVAELYREHDAKRGPFFQTDNRAILDKYFEPSLANLIWKDAVDAKGEVGALDFDPLYDAQDVEPKNLIVHEAQVDADTVRVPVTFESYGRYADGRTLRKVY